MIKKNLIFRGGVILVAVGAVFGAGWFFGSSQVVCQTCKPEAANFSLFWDAYGKLHEKYIQKEDLEDQSIIYGAISGMMKSLEDPYSEFFSPSKAKIFSQDLFGSFDGIGVEIGIKKGQLMVIAPLKGSPGERAGLKSGDAILKVDSKSTANMSIEEAVSFIRGKRGTEVILSIFRDGFKEAKDINIIRETIRIQSLDWELKDGDVAYIGMHNFDQQLTADFSKVAFEIINSPAKRIVLDLRNNPGGYLEVCQQIASWFLKDGLVVAIEDFGKGKEQKLYKAKGVTSLSEYPMVVLINEGSASASEILAGALRDNRGIKLIGEKSFGKGSVQEVVDLQDGKSFLKITVAKWLTPKGNSIAEVGLTPDIKVENLEDDPEKDSQLQKALEIVKGLK